jgi:mutator protein MutT
MGAHDSRLVTVPVLAAVIERDGQVLLCQRPAHKRHGGFWEFPGGKLETGESLDDAAHRELREELNVAVSGVGATLFRRVDPGSHFEIIFAQVEIVGEPVATEHDQITWVSMRDALNYSLAPSDRTFVNWALENLADTRSNREE